MIKYLPNTITLLRIVGSLALLFLRPLSSCFFILYVMIGISDIVDGFLARITNTVTASGAVLDSIADAIFIGIMLFLLLPLLPLEFWMLAWILVIFVIRILSWIIGFIKFRTFASLHTYSNKATGFILFCFPILWNIFGLSITVGFLCVLAGLSALEELTIIITSKELSRNQPHL